MLGRLPISCSSVDGCGVWFDSFSLVASMLGFACQVVRGFSAFAPCLEHICAGGGGGSVVNACFMIHDSVGNYM